MSLSPQFLDELRARTSLSSLISRSVKLQRAGREWKACCPFHKEKTPSFTVSDEKGFYHCFGCGAHGDAIGWLTDGRGLAFMDAVKELADAAGMDVPAPDPRAQAKADRAAGLFEVMEAAAAWFTEQLEGLEGNPAREYLKLRGVSEVTRRRFDFGYAPASRVKLKTALARFGIGKLVEAGLLIEPEVEKEPYDRFRNRLTFPIRDARGRCIAFSARILGAGEPKYLNSPDTPLFDKGRTLFNLDKAGPATRENKRLIVVEGQLDAIALDQAGVSEAVAPLGTALTEDQITLLWRLHDIPILCFDGDQAGRKAAARAALRALPLLSIGKSLNFVVLPDGMDPDDVIQTGGRSGIEKLIEEKITLDQIVWDWEQHHSDLSTPEGRASFGKKLRDHARSIRDIDISNQYLALYKQKLYDMFSPDSGKRAMVTAGGKWLKNQWKAPPELKAILDHGTDKALFAPAALEGLRRFPRIIGSHAEIVGALSVLLLNKDLKLVCSEMLAASLQSPDLTVAELEAALRAAGLASSLERLASRKRVPFSFLRPTADEQRSRRDLAAVLEILAATPEVEDALKVVTDRLALGGSDQEFAEQIRIAALKERLVQDWADLLRRETEESQLADSALPL